MIRTVHHRISAIALGAVIVTFGLLAGCSSVPSPTTGGAEPPADAAAISHIHAAVRDPANGDLLLATHEGLFRQTSGSLHRVGPVIDLMGFAIGSDGNYLASGHPGPGTDLPQPVGLITSADSGQTWQVASRAGQSDFHAMAVGPAGVIGFDGALVTSSDRTTWVTRGIPSPPRSLAASPESGTLLATTEAGLLRSLDDAATWHTLTPPEPAVLAAWADEHTIAVATTTGHLATSSDAGATWTLGPKPLGVIDTISAHPVADGQVEIIVSVGGTVLQTTDIGATTDTLLS